MQYADEAELTIRCVYPFHYAVNLKTAVKVTRDARPGHFVISFKARKIDLPISEIVVTIGGVATRYAVESDLSLGEQHELHCRLIKA